MTTKYNTEVPQYCFKDFGFGVDDI